MSTRASSAFKNHANHDSAPSAGASCAPPSTHHFDFFYGHVQAREPIEELAEAVGGQVLPLAGPTENGMMGMRVVVPKQVNFTKLMDLLFESFVIDQRAPS